MIDDGALPLIGFEQLVENGAGRGRDRGAGEQEEQGEQECRRRNRQRSRGAAGAKESREVGGARGAEF